MSALPRPFLTPEEYLEIERPAEYKSEYEDGEMFAMAGATQNHNLIVTNTVAELRERFRARSCQVFPSDMRVRVRNQSYRYPDVVAVCGPPQFFGDRPDNLINPTLLVEVLSESTELYDRGRKFELYKGIESLREYLLLASDRMHADLYTRQPDGRWMLASADAPEAVLDLESVGVRLRMADLYEKVELAELPEEL